MSWLFWLLVGFVIEWAIEMWYWRDRRIGRFTEPLEARVKELEEELRRASVVSAAGRGATTSSARAGAPSAAEPKRAEPAAAEPKPAADVPIVTSRRSTKRDDLKVIKGIGEVFQERLYDAGVTTYASLAAMSADEVAAIIKPEDWQNYDFFAWIREAAELANKG